MFKEILDVVIVGAGFGGSLLAMRMAAAGHSVLLIDRYAQMKPVFRAEKIETAQAQRLRELGVLDLRRPLAPPIGKILRFDPIGSRVVDTGEQYGISYHDTVNELRKAAQSSVSLIVAEVIGIEGSRDGACREVFLANGQCLRSRIVVLACGYRPGLHKRMNISLTQDSRLRSLFLGFDVELTDPSRLTYRGCNEHLDQGAGGIDYLTLFRVGERLRANLSVQLSYDDPRQTQLQTHPQATLQQWFPQLAACIGEFRITSRFDRFVTTYYRIHPPDMRGVIVMGDAFQSANPATGTGLSKVLADLDLLAGTYLPRWLSADSSDYWQPDTYYADANKQQMDHFSHEQWAAFTLDGRRRQRDAHLRQLMSYLDPRKYTFDRIKHKIGWD